jgi:hypothetical protein
MGGPKLGFIAALLLLTHAALADTWVLSSGPTLRPAVYPFPANQKTYAYRYVKSEPGQEDYIDIHIHRGEGLFFRRVDTGPCPELQSLPTGDEPWYLYQGNANWQIYFRSSLPAQELCLWVKAWLPEWERWAPRSQGRDYSLMPATFAFP